MFGVDLPTKNDEDYDGEVESVTSEEEEHLPEMGTISHMAAQSADIAKFIQPSDSSSTPPSSDLPPRSRAKANDVKMRDQKLTGSLRQSL